MPTASITIRFEARLLRPARPVRASWAFLIVPQSASAKLPTRGATAVDGTFAGHAFTAVLEPDGQGSHWLKVTRALLESAGVASGDTVRVEIAPASEEPEPRVPADLRKALAASTAALTQWSGLTPRGRRDWIQWIASARQATTRERRIANTCDMLASGKRRVCCFDRSGIYSKALGAPKAAE